MAYNNYSNNNSNQNSLQIQSNLQFKKQDEFWEEYFILRKKANNSLIKIYTSSNYNCVNQFFEEMGELLNWSSSYQTKKLYDEDKSKLINNLRELYSSWKKDINKIWNKDENKNKFISKCQDFWDLVSEEHKKQELLPRPEEVIEQDTIFKKSIKEETNLAMKELYRAVNDIVKNSIKTHER